jgi:choline dehydrogenase-like flavoprotein
VGELTRYDVVVVGTGAAGCVFASRLAAGVGSILLLDTGPTSADD